MVTLAMETFVLPCGMTAPSGLQLCNENGHHWIANHTKILSIAFCELRLIELTYRGGQAVA